MSNLQFTAGYVLAALGVQGAGTLHGRVLEWVADRVGRAASLASCGRWRMEHATAK